MLTSKRTMNKFNRETRFDIKIDTASSSALTSKKKLVTHCSLNGSIFIDFCVKLLIAAYFFTDGFSHHQPLKGYNFNVSI